MPRSEASHEERGKDSGYAPIRGQSQGKGEGFRLCLDPGPVAGKGGRIPAMPRSGASRRERGKDSGYAPIRGQSQGKGEGFRLGCKLTSPVRQYTNRGFGSGSVCPFLLIHKMKAER